MSTIREPALPPSADQIADMADAGEPISVYFTNDGAMVQPAVLQRVSIGFPEGMLLELDRAAQALSISREAVIKSMLRQSLDQHYLAVSHQPQ